jgi:hypothetical protein
MVILTIGLVFIARVGYLISISDPGRSLTTILWVYPLVWDFHVLVPFTITMGFAIYTETTRRRIYLAMGAALPFILSISRGILGGYFFGPMFVTLYFGAQIIVGGVLSIPLLLNVNN